MKYSTQTYLDQDPYAFSDVDIDVRCRKTSIVKTRKPHTCIPPIGELHDIKAGEMAFRESAFVDGKASSNYICIPCLDKYIESVTYE